MQSDNNSKDPCQELIKITKKTLGQKKLKEIFESPNNFLTFNPNREKFEKFEKFINKKLFTALTDNPPTVGEYCSYLIGVNNGYHCAVFDTKITAIKTIAPYSKVDIDELSGYLDFLFGFLEGCSENGFDAYAEFQKYCDRFLENYE